MLNITSNLIKIHDARAKTTNILKNWDRIELRLDRTKA